MDLQQVVWMDREEVKDSMMKMRIETGHVQYIF